MGLFPRPDSAAGISAAVVAAVSAVLAPMKLQLALANGKLDGMSAAVSALQAGMGVLMTSEQQLETTLKAVEADMAVIGTGVTGLQTQVTALTAQVAVLVAGQPVTQDQLDALNATGSALETQTDTLAAIFAPPAAPPAA